MKALNIPLWWRNGIIKKLMRPSAEEKKNLWENNFHWLNPFRRNFSGLFKKLPLIGIQNCQLFSTTNTHTQTHTPEQTPKHTPKHSPKHMPKRMLKRMPKHTPKRTHTHTHTHAHSHSQTHTPNHAHSPILLTQTHTYTLKHPSVHKHPNTHTNLNQSFNGFVK